MCLLGFHFHHAFSQLPLPEQRYLPWVVAPLLLSSYHTHQVYNCPPQASLHLAQQGYEFDNPRHEHQYHVALPMDAE